MNHLQTNLKGADSIDKALFSHFHPEAPLDVAAALLNLAEWVKSDFSYQNAEVYGCVNMNEIYDIDPGGFIPFQRGGYEVSDLTRFDGDASYHLTEGMGKAAEEAQKYAFECWLADNKHSKTREYDSLTEEEREAYFEYEQEFLQPALLRFECWLDKPKGEDVWENGTGKVFVRLSVNYSDAPYYRTKSDETLHALHFDPVVFVGLEPSAIWEALMKAPPDGDKVGG